MEVSLCSKDTESLLKSCLELNMPLVAHFLSMGAGLSCPEYKPGEKRIRVRLYCNWLSSQELARLWNKMSKGNFSWGRIFLVWDDTAEYFVVINAPPPGTKLNRRKTIVFQMEPKMAENPKQWGEWADPNEADFLKVFKHRTEYNNNEWHLSKNYSELSRETPEKTKGTIISAVLSAKYSDPGHVLRIDFVKFLEKKGVVIHVYGDNKWGYMNYQRPLPYHAKDDAIFPYKYTFNCENHSIPNYYTEKLIDGILGECLVFYWGCPNIRNFIDPLAYVQLDLDNFESSYKTIKKALEEDWHTQRLPHIREAKKKILNELQFFPRIEKLLTNVKPRLKLYVGLHNKLGNRLLPICSALAFKEVDILLHWTDKPGRSCMTYYGEGAKFEEMFEPISEARMIDLAEFEKDALKAVGVRRYDFSGDNLVLPDMKEDTCVMFARLPIIPESMKDEKFTLSIPGKYKKTPFFERLHREFARLTPVKQLQEPINIIKRAVENGDRSIGVHLRRTDGSFAQRDWSKTDQVLLKRIPEWLEKKYTVFLSSDDRKYESIPGVTFLNNPDKYNNDKNGTILGVIDMFGLASCKNIISCTESTFGLCAALIGNSDLWYLSEDPGSVPDFP